VGLSAVITFLLINNRVFTVSNATIYCSRKQRVISKYQYKASGRLYRTYYPGLIAIYKRTFEMLLLTIAIIKPILFMVAIFYFCAEWGALLKKAELSYIHPRFVVSINVITKCAYLQFASYRFC